MDEVTVLITSAGSAPAVAVIKALRAQCETDVEIIAVDMDPLSPGFHLSDRSHLVVHPDDDCFIPRMMDICSEEQVSFIFPIIDEELLVFARNRKTFGEKGIRVIVNDAEVIIIANNKLSANEFCLSHGIKIPGRVAAGADPEEQAGDVGYPLIVKPLDGRGSVGVQKIHDREELAFALQRGKGLLVQEFIEGDEYTIDIVASPRGEILQAVPRRRLVTKAGMSYKGKTAKDVELMEYGKTIAREFGVNGPANVQCIVGEGGCYFIELNPKFGAGLPLTVAAGVNVPLLLLKMAMGCEVSTDELDFQDNLYMLRYWQEIFTKEG